MNLTLGSLFQEIQSDISNLAELKTVRRAANRAIAEINDVFMGYEVDEVGVIRQVANTEEAITFNAAGTIVTTTDFSAAISPGDIVVIFGSLYNDGIYPVTGISTVTITVTGDITLIAEAAVTCTISVFTVKRRELLAVTQASLTYGDDDPDTITDAGAVNDFEDLGVILDDLAIITGSTLNDSCLRIASASGYVITLNVNEAASADTTDPGNIQIVRPSLGYLFDAENNEIILPENVKRIVKVFKNNTELTAKSFEYVAASANASKTAFAMAGRDRIKLTTQMGNSADDELRLVVEKSIPDFLGNASGNDITVPKSMRNTILSGTIMHIAAKNQFKNEDLFNMNKTSFERGLGALEDQELARRPHISQELNYPYFKPAQTR